METSFEDIKLIVDTNIDLITFGRDSVLEASERCTKFLVITSLLAEFKMSCELKKSKLATLREACYAQAMNKSEAKNVTEKKSEAESAVPYTDAREQVEQMDAYISWARTNMDIFTNAHVTYRQISKGD